ncbi:hypothetical protein ACFYU8_18540 [Brevibacillus sp. NPDC003359]|uniref:hypothetical protein n=1 Tax=unclassified Brevibacillus TaxID=2684853 RepID=UPI00368B6B98
MADLYDLTFFEAVEKCLNGQGFVRGSDFKPGLYVENRNGVLVLIDGTNYSIVDNMFISKGVISQKYKLFNVANKKELELE